MDNLIDGMEIPEPTFRNDDNKDEHSRQSDIQTSPAHRTNEGTAEDSRNTEAPATLDSLHIPNNRSSSPRRNTNYVPRLEPFPSIETSSVNNSDHIIVSIPEVAISSPSVSNDLDRSLRMYHRKTEVQKISDYYAKVESMERDETIKCIASSMLFIVIVVFIVVVMFTVNPAM